MGRVFVQHTTGCDIGVFEDTEGFPEVGRISLGRKIKPDYLFVSKDGKLLYTNWSDMSWREPGYPDPAKSWFTAHDTTTLEEIWRVDIVSGIGHYALDPAERYAYNAVVDRPQVVRVDLQTRAVEYISVTSLGGHGVKVLKDGSKCYVGSIFTGDFWEIDTATARMSRLFGFPAAVRPFAPTPDGKQMLVQNSHLHGFQVLDLAAWQIVDTVHLPDNPPDTPREVAYPFTVDHGILFAKDGTQVFILATTANEVYALDYPGYGVRGRLIVGTEPSYLTLSPDGARLFVTSRKTDEFHVIDTATFRIVANRKGTGNYPQRIAVGG
jgi:YVTN family beta-propeller protein